MRFIDDKSLERLGFRKLLTRVETLSPYGKVKLNGSRSHSILGLQCHNMGYK